MIYVIDGKPYVKVSNYYKEIKIIKMEKEYSASPIGGEETRIYDIKGKDISTTTIEEYMKKQHSKRKKIDN